MAARITPSELRMAKKLMLLPSGRVVVKKWALPSAKAVAGNRKAPSASAAIAGYRLFGAWELMPTG